MIRRSAIIGISMLLLPQIALAQCPTSPQAQALAGADPLGHYTKKVVDRVNAGIANAKAQPGGDDVVTIFNLHYLSKMQSIFYMLVDTDLRAVEYKRDLTTLNSCMHYDLAILESKIEEVRCETLEAYKNKSPGGIRKLKSLANFLNQRYKHLVKGGMEPEHEDTSWPYYFQFDDPFEGWCCVLDQMECQVKTSDGCEEVTPDGHGGNDFFPTKNECLNQSICVLATDETASPKYVKQCPFDSDYLTSSTNGYGCDISVLQKIQPGIIPGVDAEVDALTQLAETRDEFLEDISHIKDTTVTMDNLMNQNMLSNEQRDALQRFGDTTVDEVEHKRVYGCDADLTPEEWGERESPDGEEENAGFEGELTEDIKPSREWIRIPMRSAFFFTKDHLEIWKTFFRLQNQWALEREYPDYIKNPEEFYREADRERAMKSDASTFRLISIPRNYLRVNIWQKVHRQQAANESGILTKTQDSGLQIRDAMKPIRTAMMKNIELIRTPTSGMRQFVTNYAYYLRRSCIYRPCNEKLEQIIKIVLSSECFPYTSGENGSWEACKDAVEELE